MIESEPSSFQGDNAVENPGDQAVLPSLVSAYHQRGYEAGYARGINDALAAVLEATEDFARLEPESAADTRRRLHVFSIFLEERLLRSPARADFGFVDGSGI